MYKRQIQDSLEHYGGEDFWWLNNGITILAESAQFVTVKELRISHPEIVNGLQLSLIHICYLYQQTDESHPATVTDITAYLKEQGIQAVRQTVYADLNALIAAGFDLSLIHI